MPVDPQGEGPGAGQEPFTVEEEEGLRRGGGRVAARATRGGVGEVEGVEEGIAGVAQNGDVDRPAWLRRRHRRTGGGGVELAAGDERRIADLLGVEPARVAAPQEPGLRIAGRSEREWRALGGMRCPAEGAAGEDQPLDPPHRVAPLDEIGGQPIEELRMARRRTEKAEVVGLGGEPLPEMPLPEPVGEDARREGIGRRRDPAGQGQPSSARRPARRHRLDRRAAAAENLREAGGDSLRHPHLRHDSRRGRRRTIGGVLLLEGRQFGRESLVGEPVGLGELFRLEGQLSGSEPHPLLLERRPLRRRQHHEPLDLRREALQAPPGPLVAGRGAERGQLALDAPDRVDPGLLAGEQGLWLRDAVVAPLDRREEGPQTLVVCFQDRIVFVVVATGAAEAHAEEHVGGRLGGVVEDVGPLLRDVDLVVFVGCLAEESGGDRPPGVVAELVAGELRDHEAVEGEVGLEGGDDPVAVAPGMGPEGVLPEAVAVGISGQIEPVAGEVLGMAGIGEESVDESLPGGGIGVGDEGPHLLGRRWHSHGREEQPADERGPIGLGNGNKPLGRQPGVDEAIDRMANCPLRHRRSDERSIGPPPPILLRHHHRPRSESGADGSGGSAGGKPGGEQVGG